MSSQSNIYADNGGLRLQENEVSGRIYGYKDNVNDSTTDPYDVSVNHQVYAVINPNTNKIESIDIEILHARYVYSNGREDACDWQWSDTDLPLVENAIKAHVNQWLSE